MVHSATIWNDVLDVGTAEKICSNNYINFKSWQNNGVEQPLLQGVDDE